MITKTRAVILREVKFRDQSKICTIYSREFGKFSVIVKGGRNPKNRLSGLFTAGNVLEAVIYRKPGREVQLASDAALLTSPMVPDPDLDRFGALYTILDLVNRAAAGEERNIPLFSALEATIGQLCSPGTAYDLLLAWFRLRIVSLLGFEPSLRRCVITGHAIADRLNATPDASVQFMMDPGGLALKTAAGGKGRAIPATAANLLLTLPFLQPEKTAEHPHDPSDAALLSSILQEYCSLHLNTGNEVRNRAIVAQLRMK